jgi:hypothetical protein
VRRFCDLETRNDQDVPVFRGFPGFGFPGLADYARDHEGCSLAVSVRLSKVGESETIDNGKWYYQWYGSQD